MADVASTISAIGAQGLPVLVPMAIVEGPIVTIVAGWLAKLGLIPVWGAIAALVIADLIGDSILYLIGRRGVARLPERWRRRLGLTDARLAQVAEHFRRHGPRTLVLGKLTHTAGALVLVTAGSARMPVLPFLWWNLLATIPKTAVFFLIGWLFGAALPDVENALFWAAILLLGGFAFALYRMTRSAGMPAE
ncbi:DedA family protein [Neotabrizicola shimadae]|uniref:DedA family protein n=1 Tax=Neotabrizicola shimadae TaxID=2807096 RepID=A0A8G0ZW49_9RHOB|nr:DedA family protein [Neotabrizicola shimadae]QYZ69773.1 DedA family protein [Neotabrizicola shimadae]